MEWDLTKKCKQNIIYNNIIYNEYYYLFIMLNKNIKSCVIRDNGKPWLDFILFLKMEVLNGGVIEPDKLSTSS